MSDIIRARQLISRVLEHGKLDRMSGTRLRWALRLMVRKPAIRRTTPRHYKPITPKMRREIRRLARTTMTIHDIATVVGLHNSGRVSEILNGKR